MTKIPRTSRSRAKKTHSCRNISFRIVERDGAVDNYSLWIFQVSSKNSSRTYLNRGIAKMNLGFTVKATSGLETALELARNSDNVDLVRQVE